MGLFRKQKDLEHITMVCIGDGFYTCNVKVAEYIRNLEMKSKDLQEKLQAVETELKSIKPALEFKDLKPAVSKSCQDCMYAVFSNWDHAILGCRKDAICEDFKENKDDRTND